jgi:hypothetical protein
MAGTGTTNGGISLTQSVERALSVLLCFSDAQPRLRVTDIAAQLELNQSTVSRLLATMESLGFVERDARTGLYGPGLELVTLGGLVLNQLESCTDKQCLSSPPRPPRRAWRPIWPSSEATSSFIWPQSRGRVQPSSSP